MTAFVEKSPPKVIEVPLAVTLVPVLAVTWVLLSTLWMVALVKPPPLMRSPTAKSDV